MNKIALTALILSKLYKEIKKYFTSLKQDSKIPADHYMYNLMLERLASIALGSSTLIELFETNRNTDFTIEIILRPFLQDYLIFEYFQQKVNIATSESTDEDLIKKILHEHGMCFLSDGLAMSIAYIDKLDNSVITKKQSDDFKQKFRTHFAIWFKDEPDRFMEVKYSEDLSLSKIIKKLKTHKDHKKLMKIYEDYYMVLSKKEHFGVIGKKISTISDQNKIDMYFNIVGYMINHALMLILHISFHTKKTKEWEMLLEGLTEISNLHKTRKK